ncbi:DUF2948 family protein [Szabonella alba]|uniref:DUF2948 family protein n=1 Tax=Szabonella alba TaxID=2804194 RepID=A0A8K0Y0Q9_9RHOB|nr:DUF2948 family protein [Szabonella alba]MBL4917373.1 DUF2948 family protein [Szabonella alba]
MTDASYADGAERPLAFLVQDAGDLTVLSALLQDAVLTVADLRHIARSREFALLANRFRWEDREAATREGRAFERVRTMVLFRDVMAVRSQGLPRGDEDTVLSILSLEFEPGEDGTGAVILTLAGDGALRLEVEALNATARDVTRPYRAPSGKAPDHGA